MKLSLLLAPALVASMLVSNAAVAVVSSPLVTVTRIYADTAGSADIAFLVSGSTSGCSDGFWLRRADPGFAAAYAALLAMYASQGTLLVYADNSTGGLWPGSSGQFCRVTSLIPSLTP